MLSVRADAAPIVESTSTPSVYVAARRQGKRNQSGARQAANLPHWAIAVCKVSKKKGARRPRADKGMTWGRHDPLWA